MEKTITTFCGICERSCGMQVTVQDNALKSIEGYKDHVRSKGDLCVKGMAAGEILSAPDRLRHPMKKVNNRWEQISWGEAFTLIAEKLQEVKEKYGANSLAVYHGQTYLKNILAMAFMKRFLRLYGTPNLCSAASECFMPHLLSGIATFGGLAMADAQNSRSIIMWGANPFASGSQFGCSMPRTIRMCNELKKNGVRFITVDPRTTPVARMSDIHLKVRPGTDGALAFGMMRVLLDEHLYNKIYVEKYTSGFDQLRNMLKDYDLDKVSNITLVPKEDIIRAARMFAATTPASIIPGVGVEHHTNTVQTIRAISILLALTGNIDVKGGNTFMSPVMFALEDIPDTPAPSASPIGMDEHPMFVGMINQAHALVLVEKMLNFDESPIKALLVAGGDPIPELAHTGKVKEAFKKLDFMAVIDLFMTPTAQLADVVLPAAFFLERDEIGTMPVNLQRKAVDAGDCLSDWKIWQRLASRMGYEKYFPWSTFEEAADELLGSAGLSYKELNNHPEGILKEMPVGTLLQNGFYTYSGKIEIYSNSLESAGYDPLPVFHEPMESPVSTPELAAEYPLILTTGARQPMYIHSQHRTIPALKKLNPEPFLEMHPVSAKTYSINDGDIACIESQRGKITMKAHITDAILPGVVHIPHGWADADCNMLTDYAKRDPVSGFPGLKSSLCRVSKA